MRIQSTTQRISAGIKRHPWIVAVSLAATVGLWMASGLNAGGDQTEVVQAQTEPAAPTRTTVQVRMQQAEPVERFVIVNGRTEPARVVELKAETYGRVERTGVRRGDRVNSGEVIVELDARDREARLEQARATLKQRQLEYEGRESLKPKGYASETNLAESVAALEAAKAELKRAELDLQYMSIRAPFDGALQDRTVEVGDYVAPGDPIAVFVDDRSLIVTAGVAEQSIHLVKTRAPAQARLITGELITGTIRYVAPVADAATRTFTVELEVPNDNGDLPAGVTAKLEIPGGAVLAQRVSPSLLTLDDEGNLGVKIVDEEGRVEFRVADVAKSSSEALWLAGLPATTTIITVGQGFVSEGQLVDTIVDSSSDTVVAEMPAGEAP